MNGRMNHLSSGHRGLLAKIAMGVVVLSIALTLLLLSRNAIYETDEAALLAGSVSLCRGADWLQCSFYNYDRQFVAYWFHALLFRAASLVECGIEPVTIANGATTLFFWVSLLVFLLKSPLTGRRIGFLSGIILAPCLLLHSSFATTAFLSGAFLLLLAATLRSQRRGARGSLCFLLSFCATGARADAVLLIPWLLWLTASRRNLKGLWISAPARMTCLGALTALVAGRALYAGDPFYFDVALFKPDLFMAYLVFGLGGCLIVFGSSLAAMVGSLRMPSPRSRAFQVAGLVFLAVPFGYYAPQLYSTRYLLLAALACLVFILSRRGWAIMKRMFTKRALLWAAALAMALAVVPLVIGIRLPQRNTPHITFTKPTTFPTMDGHVPMGAYLPFLFNRWNPDHGMYDHNRPLWRVAQQARFDLPATGPVPVLNTPMYWFVAYAVLRQNRYPIPVEPDAAASNALVYADSRSLMRTWIGAHGAGYAENAPADLLRQHAERVSPDDMGLCIMRVTPGTPTRIGTLLRNGRNWFAGNDFRVVDGLTSGKAAACIQQLRGSGRRIIVAAMEGFAVTTAGSQGGMYRRQSSPAGEYYRLNLTDDMLLDGPPSFLAANTGLFYTVFFSALPEYMSVVRFLNGN